MTPRATFGEFIRAAHWHLDPATTIHGPPHFRGSAEEVSRSLLRVITVMRRYVEEMTAAFPASGDARTPRCPPGLVRRSRRGKR